MRRIDRIMFNALNNCSSSEENLEPDDMIPPAAPMYSPSTPLRSTNIEADILDMGSEPHSSPILYMPSSTLDSFQTMSGIRTPIREEPENLSEVDLENNSVLTKHYSPIWKYIENTSDSNDSSDDDVTVTAVTINVKAIVHSDGTKHNGNLTTHVQDTDVSHIDEETTVRTLQTESIESNSGKNINNCPNPGHSQTSVGLISLHTELTHTSDSSAVRTLQNDAIETNPEENIEISLGNSNVALSSVGRPKKGRKRKHPEFTYSSSK